MTHHVILNRQVATCLQAAELLRVARTHTMMLLNINDAVSQLKELLDGKADALKSDPGSIVKLGDSPA